MARLRSDDRGVPYFAAFLDLLHQRVVVVGGGSVATTKVRALLPCRPHPLVVIAPRASAEIRRAAARGDLVWHARPYATGDLQGAVLAFGATDDRAENARVAADARALAIRVLAVDDVPNCDFIAPALVRRGDVTIAISTNGRSPAMARRTRERLERTLPPYWADLLDVAASARERLGQTRSLIDPEDWQRALDGDVEQLAARGELAEATELLLRKLERSLFEASSDIGQVSLVGAGPGDPDLLTVRALKRLQEADVVVHDRLIGDGVLALARSTAKLIDVGKSPGGSGARQTEIEALLIELARDGKRVVRLKGGDPYLFGRGGEEALALARAGVPFEVVPGVSSALAAPAAIGIPVTHRGLSSSVTVATGHDWQQQDWTLLARSRGTLVLLMAVEHLDEVAAALQTHGRSSEEPAAVVQWATTAHQRSVRGSLGEIARLARRAGLGPPAVLVVGPTAALGAALAGAQPVATAEQTDLDSPGGKGLLSRVV
jgi:uroporphyrin-III C-methyltransferase/precorrin-2 dehydrogenase/sirohydrochlorin ferrochelatase